MSRPNHPLTAWRRRAYYELLTYGSAAYALAGYNGYGEISNVDRWTEQDGWQAMASAPLANHG